MARYPCDADEQRYGGAQRSIYLSAYTDGGKWGRLLRLCKPHFEHVSSLLTAATTSWSHPDSDEPISCPVCHKLDSDGYLVATIFDEESDGLKIAGCICPEHVPSLLATLGVHGKPEERNA